MTDQDERAGKRARRKRRALTIAAVSVLAEGGVLRSRGYGFAGNVVVRCRDGHLFTTLWIPGASIKALRCGPWRFQRCPVGDHWSIVTPVKRSELTAEDQIAAAEHRGPPIP